MSINATTSSSSVSASSASSQVSSSGSTDSTQKTSTESSFKDEMDKVSSNDQKAEENKTSNTTDNNNQSATDKQDNKDSDDNMLLEGNADYSNFGSISVLDANSMLTNDIMQMMGLNAVEQTENETSGLMTLDFSKNSQVSMTESDANFFLSLTQNNDVSTQNITAQAQAMLNNGADVAEVKQNVQISQTLLNAINIAKENNQPLRIDFDQNVSVILRFNKDGAISANFIPGDKAVEQYLKNNLSTLKATFEEQDLPYSDLSYSNRGSKQQKEQRRNNGK